MMLGLVKLHQKAIKTLLSDKGFDAFIVHTTHHNQVKGLHRNRILLRVQWLIKFGAKGCASVQILG